MQGAADAGGTPGDEAVEIAFRVPGPPLSDVVRRIVGYRERMPARLVVREAASLVVPMVISFGSPFAIALDREPDASDEQPSFVAGLHPGPVTILSDGAAACVEVDFTPLGAARLFGGQMPDLASTMVPLPDVVGREMAELPGRLADMPSWPARFDAVEALLASLLAATKAGPSAEVAFVYGRIAAGEGRVAALAGEVGWSPKHLGRRFRAETGVAPKTLARMVRFGRACRLAARGGAWADVAAGAGFADQAHLCREFAALAGEPPTAWARRRGLTDPRLARE